LERKYYDKPICQQPKEFKRVQNRLKSAAPKSGLAFVRSNRRRLKRIASDLVELRDRLAILNSINNKPERTMKTKFYLAGGVCAASFAFCMPLNAQLTPGTTASPAASPQATASPAAKLATRPMPFLGKISAVDQNAKTFTVMGKQASKTFKVTENTTITKAGAAATMTDIVQDEKARGTYLTQADGTLEARMVKIGPRTEGEKKARKSKKGAAAAEGSPAASPTP
jgi:hypothetical protein